METIDLTNGRRSGGPKVGLFARFPPSVSASASGAALLTQQLTQHLGWEVEVFRLVLPGEPSAGAFPVVMDLNPRWHLSAQLAAQRANTCDVAALIIDRHVPLGTMADFIAELQVPVVLWVDDVVSTRDPVTGTLAALAGKAARVIVPSVVAKRRLEGAAGHQLAVDVIPHGSHLSAAVPRDEPHGRLLTWGYIGPGLGAERVIRALAILTDLDPVPVYRLVGIADPAWSHADAQAYRKWLSEEAERLGIADQVEVVPIVHSTDDLRAEIDRCDLVVVPYDDTSRTASRILNEAVSSGRPVVATAFPGAIEVLASGAGITVAHDSVADMAAAIRRYLTEPELYNRAARLASALGADLRWNETARRFADVLMDVVNDPELAHENSS